MHHFPKDESVMEAADGPVGRGGPDPHPHDPVDRIASDPDARAPGPDPAEQAARAGRDPGPVVLGGPDVSAGTEIGPDTVVVGVDGSAASRAALRWALAHGGTARVPVVGVTAWHSPVQTSPRQAAGRSETAERALADARAAVRAAQAGADVPVLTGHGRAAAVLTEHSAGAAMLVLGNSRPGALTAAASTVVECLRTASVPVVVVPGAGE